MSREITNCPLCGYDRININRMSSKAMYRVICKRCGEYFITDRLLKFRDLNEKLESKSQQLSGYCRELHEQEQKPPTLTSENYMNLSDSYMVPDIDDVNGKAEKLLQRLKDKSNYYGDEVRLNYTYDYPLAYSANRSEFREIVNFLEDSHLITIDTDDVKLTAEGWGLAKKLKGSLKEGEQVFVAIWFDPSMEDSANAIIKAVRKSGYKPMCIKDEHFSDRIMDKALSEIKKSKFIVIDLTGARNSVFFEAGFSYGLGIEALYVYHKDKIKAGTPMEFYVKHYQCYGYSDIDELEIVLKDAIGARIK